MDVDGSCQFSLRVGGHLELPPLHFPNPGRGSGGITPGKFLEFHMRFGAF